MLLKLFKSLQISRFDLLLSSYLGCTFEKFLFGWLHFLVVVLTIYNLLLLLGFFLRREHELVGWAWRTCVIALGLDSTFRASGFEFDKLLVIRCRLSFVKLFVDSNIFLTGLRPYVFLEGFSWYLLIFWLLHIQPLGLWRMLSDSSANVLLIQLSSRLDVDNLIRILLPSKRTLCCAVKQILLALVHWCLLINWPFFIWVIICCRVWVFASLFIIGTEQHWIEFMQSVCISFLALGHLVHLLVTFNLGFVRQMVLQLNSVSERSLSVLLPFNDQVLHVDHFGHQQFLLARGWVASPQAVVWVVHQTRLIRLHDWPEFLDVHSCWAWYWVLFVFFTTFRTFQTVIRHYTFPVLKKGTLSVWLVDDGSLFGQLASLGGNLFQASFDVWGRDHWRFSLRVVELQDLIRQHLPECVRDLFSRFLRFVFGAVVDHGVPENWHFFENCIVEVDFRYCVIFLAFCKDTGLGLWHL